MELTWKVCALHVLSIVYPIHVHIYTVYQSLLSHTPHSLTHSLTSPCVHSAAPKFTMQPTDLDLLYGTTATIVCAFNGFPKPSVEWRVNRQTLTSNNERIKMTSCATSSILEIIMLCYEDIGTYGCYITNNSGSNSAHMTLNIHGE